MEHVKQILEVLRDLGIILGIPTLIALLLKTANARVVILKDHIAKLTETHHAQVELLRITIEAQEKQYERELERLRQEKNQAVSTSDSQKEQVIERDIEAVKRSIVTLDRLRWSISGGIESEAVRKFEWFCRDLTDPDTVTADHIFSSATYGYGISSVHASVLEQRGFIENVNGSVRLTRQGKEIWRALHLMKQG